MKKILIILAVPLLLAGCSLTTLTNLVNYATEATIPTNDVKTALDAYAIGEVTATNYVSYCTPNPSPAGCYPQAIAQLITLVDSGNTASTNLINFMNKHGTTALGAAGDYDALVAAENTIAQIVAQYSISGAAPTVTKD